MLPKSVIPLLYHMRNPSVTHSKILLSVIVGNEF